MLLAGNAKLRRLNGRSELVGRFDYFEQSPVAGNLPPRIKQHIPIIKLEYHLSH
jgi:hypothetical protein